MNRRVVGGAARERLVVQVRSLFWTLWLGPMIGAILVTVLHSFLHNAHLAEALSSLPRHIAIVYLLGAAFGYPAILLLVRVGHLDFVGFSGTGGAVGGILVLLRLAAESLAIWPYEATLQSIVFVSLSAIAVAWSTWAVFRVAGRIERRD